MGEDILKLKMKKKKHTNDDIVMIVIKAKMGTVWRNEMMRAGDAEPCKPC